MRFLLLSGVHRLLAVPRFSRSSQKRYDEKIFHNCFLSKQLSANAIHKRIVIPAAAAPA